MKKQNRLSAPEIKMIKQNSKKYIFLFEKRKLSTIFVHVHKEAKLK